MPVSLQMSPESSTPLIIAHRGARDQAPDNTRSAFEHALKYPVDGIELDVQMSADGVPVLFHDRTLYRILKRRRRLSSLTYDDLARFDWGAWYDPAFTGEPLLTLEQALRLLAGRTRMLIEIKSREHEQRSGHAYRLARKVAAMVAGGAADTVHILSFDSKVLDIVHRIAPQLRCVLNVSEKEPNMIMAAPADSVAGLWAVDIKIRSLSTEFVQWARRNHLQVYTYTCNSRSQVRTAMNLGVDGILTDRPGWLTKFLGRHTGSVD